MAAAILAETYSASGRHCLANLSTQPRTKRHATADSLIAGQFFVSLTVVATSLPSSQPALLF